MVNMCLKAIGDDANIGTIGDPDADFKYFKLVPEYIYMKCIKGYLFRVFWHK